MSMKINTNKPRVNWFLERRLVNLGLSSQEAKMYLVLLAFGSLSASEVAFQLRIFPQAVYRLAKKLESKKMIAITKTAPLVYEVLPPRLAIASFAERQAVEIEKQSKELIALSEEKNSFKKSQPTHIEVSFGQREMFEWACKIINSAKKEILIISIGEHVPQEILVSNKRATERGVEIRFIAHKFDNENRAILENFKKNSMDVRHYPGQGFHLAIADRKRALLSVSNPQKTRERTSILLFNEGMSKALADYFDGIWDNAIVV